MMKVKLSTNARSVKLLQYEHKKVADTTELIFLPPLGKCVMSEVNKMVFMDLKTFDLWAESNIDGFHNEQIELDEVIAPIIQELNLKGYKTKFCCSGHPYTSLNEAFTNSEETAKGLGGLVKTEKTDNEDLPIRALYIAPDDYFYISFDGISSKNFSASLPDGFWWEDDIIRFEYSASGVYEMLEERLNACKTLYQWARKLPSK